MRFLKYDKPVLGHDDEPIQASFDPGTDKKRAGSTADVFLSVLYSYRPETKIVLSAAEIDALNGARRVFLNARDENGLELLRNQPYIRLDSEHFLILVKITREICPINLQLWDQTPHLMRLLQGALEEKDWDREQRAAKSETEAEAEGAGGKAAARNGRAKV